MKQITAKRIAAGLMAAGLILGTATLVAADDQIGDVEIKVQGLLTAVSCDAQPQTTTVRGLVIDAKTAAKH